MYRATQSPQVPAQSRGIEQRQHNGEILSPITPYQFLLFCFCLVFGFGQKYPLKGIFWVQYHLLTLHT